MNHFLLFQRVKDISSYCQFSFPSYFWIKHSILIKSAFSSRLLTKWKKYDLSKLVMFHCYDTQCAVNLNSYVENKALAQDKKYYGIVVFNCFPFFFVILFWWFFSEQTNGLKWNYVALDATNIIYVHRWFEIRFLKMCTTRTWYHYSLVGFTVRNVLI